MKKIFYSLLFLFCAYLTLSAQQQVTCGVFTFDVLITPVTCNGDCDGAIQITNISGGTPSYTTFWSTGSTVPSIFNLCADDYTVFISDAMGDTCSMTFTVPQPDSLLVFESVTDASCAGCCDGNIVLTPTGGSPPYTYVFTPSNPPGTFCPGNYSYCVIDTNGCSTCDTAEVSFPTSINNNAEATTFSIFPNPTKAKIYLNAVKHHIEIYTAKGEKIKEEYTNEIDLLLVNSGIYYLVVKDKEGKPIYNEKIVKE